MDTGQLSPITSLCYWSQNSPVILCYESQQRPAECLHVSQTLSCQTALCGQSESQMLSCFLTLSVTNTILSYDTVIHTHNLVLWPCQPQNTILAYDAVSHEHYPDLWHSHKTPSATITILSCGTATKHYPVLWPSHKTLSCFMTLSQNTVTKHYLVLWPNQKKAILSLTQSQNTILYYDISNTHYPVL